MNHQEKLLESAHDHFLRLCFWLEYLSAGDAEVNRGIPSKLPTRFSHLIEYPYTLNISRSHANCDSKNKTLQTFL